MRLLPYGGTAWGQARWAQTRVHLAGTSHCPSTAVILHPNIWVIARYSWEISTLPILGIPRWQHASNSSAPPPLLLLPPTHFSQTPPPPVWNTITQQSFAQALAIPCFCGCNTEGRNDVLGGGAVSWVFSTFRIGVKCNKILFLIQKWDGEKKKKKKRHCYIVNLAQRFRQHDVVSPITHFVLPLSIFNHL